MFLRPKWAGMKMAESVNPVCLLSYISLKLTGSVSEPSEHVTRQSVTVDSDRLLRENSRAL